MNRRASLPGADELFRPTSEPAAPRPGPRPLREVTPDDAGGEASGRVRHDQKITVYLTRQELLDLEQARLRLRAEFDVSVDRGRIVREAVTELLQGLHDDGPDAAIVRRLT